MIKASALLERIEELGKTHPTRVSECRYVKDDGSGYCIVGTALVDLGMDPAPFLADEELNQFTNVRELFAYHGEDLGLVNDLSADQLIRLHRAQGHQDAGETWGDAISILR